MAGLNAKVSSGCNLDGTGWLQIDSVGTNRQESIEVTFSYAGGAYTGYFPPDSLPLRFSPVPANAVEYSVSVFGSESGAGTLKINGGVTIASPGEIYLDCFQCDILLTFLNTTYATAGTANGSATITATGSNGGTKQFSIDGINWQSSNRFLGLAVGNYTAEVRYVSQPSCKATRDFSITTAPISGCTNPDADNYNPAATTDNGSCIFTPRYYPTGGTLPNPVFFEMAFNAFTGNSIPKARHYVTVNLYRPGDLEPFAQKFGRVRNGSAKIDVSRELQIGAVSLNVGRGVISQDNYALFPFEFGYIESYNGIDTAEIRKQNPKRYAVRAAMPDLLDNLNPYIVQNNQESPARFLTAFETPVKFHDAPLTLAIIIDEAVNLGGGVNINLERSYYDLQNRLVQRNTTPVSDTGFIRFEINDEVIPCAAYMEVVLTDLIREQAGVCLDPTTPITPPTGGTGEVTIKDGAGNTIATVPAGGIFVIESGFSFGFRIV